MRFYNPSHREQKELIQGVQARTFWGENLMLVVVDLDANAVIPPHRHPHEQGGYMLSGAMELTIEEETRHLLPGDIYIIPGNVEHSVRVGAEPARVLDIFAPVREEYKY